jgi:membrane dipeptidase
MLNKRIERARRAALALLKPSKKDLQHGLELHASSLVVEAYGLPPRAAPDGDALKAAAEAGAPATELREMMEQMQMTRMVTDAWQRAEYQEAWQASGVTCMFTMAGEECQAPLRIMRRLAHYTFAADMSDVVDRAVMPDDIVAAKKAGRHCFYMTVNGVPLTQNWESVEEELQYIRIFFELGARMMHLTYQRRNMVGDGCGEASDAGLSDFGRAVVKEMNRVGVIVDVAHSGWRTALEAAQASEKPMVASHSGCAALFPHVRSKPDEVIKAIADTGGYIGIYAMPGFLGLSNDLVAMLDHIEYAVGKFGSDHVAVGMDVCHTASTYHAELKKMGTLRERTRWRWLWRPGPEGSPPEYADEAYLSVAWTNWPCITVGLVQRGLPDEDIRKIIGGNALRVAREVFPGGQLVAQKRRAARPTRARRAAR